MKEIILFGGDKVLVDDADFEWLNRWKWHSCHGYACRRIRLGPTVNGKRNRLTLFMHRQILNTPKGMEGEHKDQNRSNNQRYNLRNAHPIQNIRNRKKFGKKS